jgi:exonuclease SbcC
MLIQAVDLENVKSYDKLKVEFAPGVNAIVGHNGAGKSTLLEAIGFVLFDSLEYKQTDFMRGGAKSATATVTFVSSLDDRPYEVHRRIGSGAHYYVYDAQLELRICDGKADVQRFLRQHLGVEEGTDLAALFHDAVGVPQGLLTAAFLLTERDRAPIFDSLLKLRDYDRAWERLRESVGWLREQRGELAKEISNMEGRLERLPGLKVAVVEREAALAVAQRDLAAADEELCQAQQQRAALETVRSELTALENQVAQAGQLRAGIQVRLEGAQREQTEAEDALRIVGENAAGAHRYQTAQVEKQELDQKQRRRLDIEAQRMEADKQAALCETQARGAQQELAAAIRAEAEAAALAPAVAEQTRLDQALAEARQRQARLDDAQRAASQAGSQVARIRAQLAELQQGQGRVKAVEEEHAAVKVRLGTLRGQIEQASEAMGRHKSQAEALNEQTERLKDVQTAVCPVCEQPLTDGHRQDLLTRNQQRLTDMRDQYRGLLSARKAHEATLAEQEQRAKQLQDELLGLPRAQELETVAAELQHSQEALDAAQTQVTQLSVAPEQVAELVRQLGDIGDPRSRYAAAAGQANRRAALEQQQADLARQGDRARAALARAQAALDEFAGLDARLDAVAVALQQDAAAHQAVLTNKQRAESLPARQAAVAALAADLERQTAETARLEAAYRAVAGRFDAARYQQMVARVDTLQAQIGGLKSDLAHLQSEQAREQAEIAMMEEAAQLLAETQARHAKLQEQESVLERIRSTLHAAGPFMRAALIQQISDGAHQIFGEIMQDFSRRLAWNDDYSITLEVDGHTRQFAQLSGGEQMSAALSVRLALLRHMSGIDVAFFDEPTANLDETRREALARQILGVRGFRQIFVISHDDTFEQATEHLIRLVRQNGVTRVVADESMA